MARRRWTRCTISCGPRWCTDQLRRTVDGMLDLNKLEEGKMTLRESPFDVDLMVRAVTMQIKSAMEKKDLHFASEVSPLLRGVRLVGDAPKIQQVLANFCWNAVKFTSEGSVTLDVTCEMPEEGGDAPVSVFFKVIDTGEGMSKSTMERVFDRFAMGEHKVSKYGGSGLGLAICRSLAELMHGEIHCMSQPGRGSTFVLELAMLIDRSSRSSESRSADHFGEPSGTDGPPDSPESSVETGLALEGLRDAPGPSKLSRVDSNPLPAVPVPDQTSTTPTTATAAPIPTPTADASALEEKSRGVGVPRQFSRQSFVRNATATRFRTHPRRLPRLRFRRPLHPRRFHRGRRSARRTTVSSRALATPTPPLAARRPSRVPEPECVRLDPRSVILRRRRAARVTVRVERDGDSRTRRGNVCGCAGGGSRGG